MRTALQTVRRFCLVWAAMGLWFPRAIAQVPGTVSYQGQLFENNTPAADGTYTMTFAIFDAPTAGNDLWPGTGAESHAVTTSGGYYSVSLGSVDPLASDFWITDGGVSFYLEVSVNGTTLAPRSPVGSVPYAFQAGSVSPTLVQPGGLVLSDSATPDGGTPGLQDFGELWVRGGSAGTTIALLGSQAGIGVSQNWPAILFNGYQAGGQLRAQTGYDGGTDQYGDHWDFTGVIQMDPTGVFGITVVPTPAQDHQQVQFSKAQTLLTLNPNPDAGCTVRGNMTVTGTLSAANKTFVQDDPEDPMKEIVYVSQEGGEAGTYWRGTTKLIGGKARVVLPHHFALVTNSAGLTVQVTPSGACHGFMTVPHKSADSIEIEERGAKDDCAVDYLVQGIRKGYEDHQVIRPKQIVSQ